MQDNFGIRQSLLFQDPIVLFIGPEFGFGGYHYESVEKGKKEFPNFLYQSWIEWDMGIPFLICASLSADSDSLDTRKRVLLGIHKWALDQLK